MRKHLQPLVVVLFTVVTFSSCRKNVEDPQPPIGSNLFVSATPAGSYPKATLQAFATLAGYTQFVPLIKYDVDFYKIIYKTSYKGSMIDVSGLVAIPKNTPAPPSLLSAQHGTMFIDTDAPSNFPSAFTGFELFASAGFVTSIPDFIGYGVSKDIVHPYYDQQLSAGAVVDMLKAVKYYLKNQNTSISNRLFMIGYSEGGYVTMAAQKEVETHPEHQLTLTAAAEGAGGYDLQEMLKGLTTVTTYPDPSFLALLMQSYNTTYDWKRPYTDFFKEPYASKVTTLLNGTKNGAEINAELTTSVTGLFNPTFYSNLSSATGEPVLKQALQNNSFLNWVPKSPTRLYHGTADEAVFYKTSETTFNRFKAAGATNVEFYPIPNGTHGTSIEPMFLNALPWILSLDK